MDKIIGKIADKVEEHQNRHSQAKIDQQVPIPRREGGHGIDNSGSSGGMGSSTGYYESGSGGFSHQDDMDLRGAADHAASHPNTNESPEFFSGILDKLGSKKQHVVAQQERIDEQEAIAHHRAYYPEYSNSSSAQTSSSIPSGPPPSYKEATSQSMGTAAALQALKLFTSSGPSAIPSAVGSSYTPTSSFSPNSNTLGPSGVEHTRSSGGGGSKISQTAQSILIGLAMNQAAKLFEQQASRGNLEAGASKESAVMKAGEMALRLFLQSQRDSGPGNKYPAAGAGMPLGGGGTQGQHAGLLSLAQRMMAA